MAGSLLTSANPAKYEAFKRAMLANRDARSRFTAVLRKRAALSPDKTEIANFVNALFKYADSGTHVSLRAFHGDNERWPEGWGNVKLNGKGFDELIDKATRLVGACARSNKSVVFCPPIATFRTERNARGVNLACGLVLTVECDKAAEAARTRLEGILGPATVVVASGGLWADPDTGEISDKLHLHWRLSEPTRDKDAHAQLKEARRIAAQLVGADRTAVNPVHPLRWPGSWHRKEAPRLAQIVTLTNEAEIDLGDALAQLREAAALAGINPRSDSRPGPDATADIRDIVAALGVISNDDLPWAEWNRHGMMTWRSSGSSEDGREAFHVWSAKSNKYDYAETDDRWDHYFSSPPTEIGAASLFYEARKFDPHFVKPSDGDSLDEVFGATPSRFPLTRFRDIRIDTKRRYVVRGLIPREGLVVAWGPPKCGKSFWITDVGLHVSLGWEYRGRRVEQGAVIYVACEGQAGVPQRIEAFKQTRLAENPSADPPFFLLPTQLNLIGEVKELIAEIRAQLGMEAPVMIVLDTLNRSLVGSESKDEDMSAYIAACEEIRQAFNCAVVIIHHCGIEGTRPRGHTSLTGAVDAQIAIKRVGATIAKIEFMKDGEEGDEIVSRLEAVVVGTDEDGEEITSCVVSPCELVSPSHREKLPASEHHAFAIFEELDAKGNVTRSEFRRACISSNKLSASDKPKTQAKAFERACLSLVRDKLIVIDGENVLPFFELDE